MFQTELTFKDGNGDLVVIMPSALNKLMKFKQLDISSLEAAGVLIGERRGKHLVIKLISEPGVGDIRSRTSVNRKGAHHQSAVDIAYHNSQRTLDYIGEWHSHPEDEPSPSSQDLISWRKHITHPEPMVLLILGRCKIWVAKKIFDEIKPLSMII